VASRGWPVLRVIGLSKRFGGLRAVQGVDLDVPAGGITALIGPNGAGKTTTFAMIAGFIRPDAGTVVFDGTDVTGWAPERVAHRGMVRTFQITQPFAGLTVAENIRVGAFLRVHGPVEAMAQAREVGTRLGLGPMLDRPAAALTVAGRKRLEVARALATRPRLLLLDEVMAGLNQTEIQEIVDLVQRLNADGHTFLVIEHNLKVVRQFSHRVIVLHRGAMLAEGTAEDVLANPAVVEAYVGKRRSVEAGA